MKLKNELQNVILRFNELDKDSIIKHIESVVESKEYKDLETRITWDIFRVCYNAKEVCELYEKYNCNDTHIDTLVKRAFKELNIDLTKYSK